MKRNVEEQEQSGLLLGSEPLGGVQHRSAAQLDDTDGGADKGDSDGTDSDKSDSDLTDSKGDKSDSSDADGRD